MQFPDQKIRDGRILKIREASTNDTSSILKFLHSVSAESDFLTFGSGEFENNEEKEREYLQNQYDSQNQLYLIATVEDSLVAILNFYAGTRSRVRHSGEFSMAVSEEYWGKGIGAFLIDALIKWAESTHIIKKINLRVRTDNHNAIHLYKKKGFVTEGTIRKEICIDEKYYDLMWMGREL